MSSQLCSFVIQSGLYQTKGWTSVPVTKKLKGVRHKMADKKVAEFDPVALAQYLKYEYHIHDASFMEFAHNFYQVR